MTHASALRRLVYSAPFAAPLSFTEPGFPLLMDRMGDPSGERWLGWILVAAGALAVGYLVTRRDRAVARTRGGTARALRSRSARGRLLRGRYHPRRPLAAAGSRRARGADQARVLSLEFLISALGVYAYGILVDAGLPAAGLKTVALLMFLVSGVSYCFKYPNMLWGG